MRSRPSPFAAAGFALALLLLLGGCATVAPRPDEPPPAEAATDTDAPYKTLADLNRAEALRLEGEGLPRQSVERWRIVADLQPEDAEARQRVETLEQELDAAAKRHFEKGRALVEAGKVKAARKELILALGADPDHAEALGYLKGRLEPIADTYITGKGDTLEGIAERTYGSPVFAALLARLNDVGAQSPLAPGRKLLLPLLGDEVPVKSVTTPAPVAEAEAEVGEGEDSKPGEAEAEAERAEDYVVRSEAPPEDRELAMARDHFEAGNFEEAIYIARLVPPDGPPGEKAKDLVNASYLGLGRRLHRENRNEEALDILGKAEPASEDVKKLISEIEQILRKEAEEHYLAGIRFFIDQKLDDAIAEWEKTLVLYPEHPKARKDLDKALKLSERLQKIR